MRISIFGLIFCVLSAPALSTTFADDTFSVFTSVNDQYYSPTINQALLLAEAIQDEKSVPEDGSLIIPGEDQSKEKKKCLNICKKWGENCIINPRTGARDCRRTCKEFGEECFSELNY
jgi:hypothetical protein